MNVMSDVAFATDEIADEIFYKIALIENGFTEDNPFVYGVIGVLLQDMMDMEE